MVRKLRTLAIFTALSLVMLQFNNCEVYSENGVFEQNELLSSCLDSEDAECFSSDDSLLEIRINTENDITITSNVAFMLSGDCNEASFDNTQIAWTASKNSSTIAQSPTEFPCENGRFNFPVTIVGTSGDDIKVEVDIKARDENGQIHRNPLDSLGRSSIFVHIQ